jgi:phage gpG-like protein
MIKIEYTDNDLTYRLRGLRQAIGDLRPVWEGPVHRIFLTMMKEQFKQEGAYNGEKWTPLSPAYAAWKVREVGHMPILQLYGPLSKSLTEVGAPDQVMRVGPSFAEYGTSVVYAATHHFGDPGRNIPQRRVIPKFTQAEGTRIVYSIMEFLLKKMRTRSAPTAVR